MEHIFYAIVKIQVESELPLDELIEELGSESYYTIDSTENIEVLDTEWIETTTQKPY